MAYQMAPLPMPLNYPEGHFCCLKPVLCICSFVCALLFHVMARHWPNLAFVFMFRWEERLWTDQFLCQVGCRAVNQAVITLPLVGVQSNVIIMSVCLFVLPLVVVQSNVIIMSVCLFVCLSACMSQYEALLLQRHCATRYISKFVPFYKAGY